MADFTVAMVDYDYATLEVFEREVLKLGGAFISKNCKDVDEAIAFGKEADGWLVQYTNPINAKVFSACHNLKVVGRCGIGYDVIDVPAATAAGVVATNVPSYCEDEVSDHAMALLLTAARRTALYTASVKRGVWDWKVGAPIQRLRGQTLGLCGFGKIPRTLVPKAKAFGMKVACFDPYLKPEVAQSEGVELVDFDTLLSVADYISVHCPLTDETRGMFNAAAFAKMKSSAIIVNTARGPIIDLPSLTEALKTGAIAGAGLDVLPSEPPAEGEELLTLDNVALSPHVGWYSEQSIVDLQAKIARNVAMVCAGRKPEAIINREVLDKLNLQ